MKRIIVGLMLALLCTSALFAQAQDAAKSLEIAVYITSEANLARGVKESLKERVEHALNNKTNYTVVERSESYLATRAKELEKQMSGAVDDAQIREAGREAGVQFICEIRIVEMFNEYQISAKIVDVETSIREKRDIGAGITKSRLRNMSDFETVSEELIAQMFGLTRGEALSRRVKIGGRLAYNNSHAAGMYFIVDDYDGHSITSKRHENSMGFASSGGELGVVADFVLTRTLSLNTGLNVIFRNPVVTDAATISEAALSIPVLLRMRLKSAPVYFEGGLAVDVPFLGNLNREGRASVKHEERTPLDYGAVAGVGLFLNRNWAVDLRGTFGLNSYDTHPEHTTLLQFSVGVSALY